MARLPRLVVPDAPHHVVARGAAHQRLFDDGYDKRRYRKRFAALADEAGVLVHGYCLMDNHVHWILTPTRADSLARLFHRLHTWWGGYMNRRRNRDGSFFAGRYRSSVLEGNHFWAALRYVEVNPRRAGAVERVEEWEFSSAKAHLAGADDEFVKLVEEAWRVQFNTSGWREYLLETDREKEARLRAAIRGNRPCGTQEWAQALQTQWRQRARPPTAITAAAAN